MLFFTMLVMYSAFVLSRISTKYYRQSIARVFEYYVYIWGAGDFIEELFSCFVSFLVKKLKVCLPLPEYDIFENVPNLLIKSTYMHMYTVFKFSPRLDFRVVQNTNLKQMMYFLFITRLNNIVEYIVNLNDLFHQGKTESAQNSRFL